jgi:hypothetical protein
VTSKDGLRKSVFFPFKLLFDCEFASTNGLFWLGGRSLIKKKLILKCFFRRREMAQYSEIKRDTAEVVGVRVVKRRNTGKAHAAIRDLIVQHASLSYKEIAEILGCSRWLIYTTAVEFGIRRPRGAGSPARRRKMQGSN